MKSFPIIFVVALLVLTSSCSVNKVHVGNYASIKGESSVYLETKDFSLFWDTVPIRSAEKKLKIKDYEIVVKRGFFDTVIYYGTIGIFSFHSVKINIKEGNHEKSTLKIDDSKTRK